MTFAAPAWLTAEIGGGRLGWEGIGRGSGAGIGGGRLGLR